MARLLRLSREAAYEPGSRSGETLAKEACFQLYRERIHQTLSKIAVSCTRRSDIAAGIIPFRPVSDRMLLTDEAGDHAFFAPEISQCSICLSSFEVRRLLESGWSGGWSRSRASVSLFVALWLWRFHPFWISRLVLRSLLGPGPDYLARAPTRRVWDRVLQFALSECKRPLLLGSLPVGKRSDLNAQNEGIAPFDRVCPEMGDAALNDRPVLLRGSCGAVVGRERGAGRDGAA